jgi:hypothetical protein
MTRLLCDESVWHSKRSRPIDQEKYKASIISGFRATGLYPVDVQQPLSKLPNMDQAAESIIQRQLLDKLNQIRHNPPSNKHPGRPKKNEKLPAGASYTCRPVPVGSIFQICSVWYQHCQSPSFRHWRVISSTL